MAHSKGLFSGTCPGNFRKMGQPRDGRQNWKCSRCGRQQNKRAPRCWFWHAWQDTGTADHGHQKQKCGKCGLKGERFVRTCPNMLLIFPGHSFHRCRKVPGTHCRNCSQGRA